MAMEKLAGTLGFTCMKIVGCQGLAGGVTLF